MKKEDRKKLYAIIKQWTRLEIIARLMPQENVNIMFPTSHPFLHKIECEDEIRKLMFGTDDLVKLGLKWNILKPYTKAEKKKLTKKQKESEKAKKEILDFFGNPKTRRKKKRKIK